MVALCVVFSYITENPTGVLHAFWWKGTSAVPSSYPGWNLECWWVLFPKGLERICIQWFKTLWISSFSMCWKFKSLCWHIWKKLLQYGIYNGTTAVYKHNYPLEKGHCNAIHGKRNVHGHHLGSASGTITSQVTCDIKIQVIDIESETSMDVHEPAAQEEQHSEHPEIELPSKFPNS